MAFAAPELCAAQDTLAPEPRPFQGLLLGHVVDGRAGLDAVHLGGGEQVLGHESLRRALAKTGYKDLKEFQKVGLSVRT